VSRVSEEGNGLHCMHQIGFEPTSAGACTLNIYVLNQSMMLPVSECQMHM